MGSILIYYFIFVCATQLCLVCIAVLAHRSISVNPLAALIETPGQERRILAKGELHSA